MCVSPRDELTARFKLTVELSSSGEGAGGGGSSSSGGQEDKAYITKFVQDPDFQYVDFAQRDKQSSYSTFRIQVIAQTVYL